VFSTDQNIHTLSELIVELKHYVELNAKSLRLNLISKFARLLAALVLGATLFLLAAIVVIFLSMMFAAAIAPHVGGEAVAYALVGAIYLLIGILLYSKRHAWIETPITNFIAHLFLDDETGE